ncbi:alpha/beta fold hydrolase [Paludisphaera mucosa]|uniref:Alpha/beta hydrolase n=1 Tax=Paludisphaera mucosa TaxID=3030827 RepID=A0ABT6FI51_9BACT|nr:alpha/beta hydrolase [Paludisphaera mucosa]MDG3007219.1 alpha/beta hydrolase [Paludisphaera mucosa]
MMEIPIPNQSPAEHEAWLRGRVLRFLTPRPTPRAPRDDELLGRGAPLDLECGLAATSWGEGPIVLLAHGWESRRSHWGAFLAPLADAGLRVVAVDAPAHGDSPGETVNVLQYGRTLAAIGAELGPLAGIVGHSFGAAATAVALRRGLRASRAVLISGPSSLLGMVGRWCARHQIEGVDAERFLALVEQDVGEPLADLDVARFAAGLTVPALVVHDQGDDAIPVAEARAVASAWPGATLRITERYGHRRILIAREVIREVAAFVKQGVAGGG